ncbi:MAG TPA: hypothetical protein VMR73_01435 [Candidatus Paceibacterota bacterium]|nr:hypothetical protein [Candidatus Paceibacterota bacterium]
MDDEENKDLSLTPEVAMPEQDKKDLRDEGIEIMGRDTPADAANDKTAAPKTIESKIHTEEENVGSQPSISGMANSKSDDDIKNLRTYKSDMADAIAHEHISVVKIAAAESDRSTAVAPIQNESPHRGLLFIAIGIIVLSIALALGGYFYFKNNSETPSPLQMLPSSLVDVTNTQTLSIGSGTNLINNFETNIQGLKIPVGSLWQIVPLNSQNLPIATTTDFFTALGVQVPGQLSIGLGGQYTFGAYGSTVNHPFIIIDISSFDNAFPAMLSWESTLPDDLNFLIAIDHQNILRTYTIPVFTDKIILNKDIREFDDASGTPEILYSFTDTHTLVITTDENTMSEIITRLNTAKVVR